MYLRNGVVVQSSVLEERRRMAKIGLGMAALGTGAAFYGASLFTGAAAIAGATPGAAIGFPFLVQPGDSLLIQKP